MKKAEEQRQAQLAWLRGVIRKGIDDIEAGRFTEINSPEELTQLLSRCSEEATRRVEARGVKIAP